MMRKMLIFTMVLCLAFVFVGCAKQEEAPKEEAPMATTEGPKKGGTIVFGRGGDSVGLDPAYETDGNSFMVCDNLYEQLVAYKDESTDTEPSLAKSWDISDDGLTIVGYGTNPGGYTEAWMATVPQEPIPEPGTLVLLATGLAGLAGYGKRRPRRRKKV